ncbi:hypothetical protein JCM8547_002502 [Rhodosporidiobolus lusitaniae]
MDSLYDPPLASSSLRQSRGRSASFSASSAPRPSLSRRQSLSSFPTAAQGDTGNLSDEEQRPLVDLAGQMDTAINGHSPQDPADAAADRKLWREGRQSKQQLLADDPKKKMTGSMEDFMAQLYDLTHSIDSLENDIDEILALRNKIVSNDPKVDIGQASLRADLDSLSALTTQSGKTIVSLETWLLSLHRWSKDVKKLVKSGQAGETMQEVGEIKYQLASAKLDFADCMERIREGAYKEQERRERCRVFMSRHIRAREPGIEDRDVKGLLKAAELGAADGVAASHVTSYAGLWALQNPFTELAELTNGMRFLHDDLDKEIVDEVTGKNAKKRTIYLNGVLPSSKKSKKPSYSSKKSSSSKKASKKPVVVPAPSSGANWFGSRYGFISTMRPQRSDPAYAATAGDDEFDRKYRYIQNEQYAAEKDLEYGFARQQQLERVNRRKKLVIALLLVIIAALVLFVVLATMRVPDQTLSFTPSQSGAPSAPTVSPETVTPVGSDQQTTPTTTTSPVESSGSSSAESASTSLSSSSDSVSSASSPSASSGSESAASASSPSSATSSASTVSYNNGLYTQATQATAATALTAATAATQATTVWWTAASA